MLAPSDVHYAREFHHQVRLANAGGWRTDHTSAGLRSVEPRSMAWGTEGSDIDGTLTSVWGFKQIEDCIWFELWATSSGIDWTERREAQHERPHLPAATPRPRSSVGTGIGTGPAGTRPYPRWRTVTVACQKPNRTRQNATTGDRM
jgi:hypothetical protein